MKRTFTLHSSDGCETLYFCKGKARWERTETKTGRMIFTVESPKHIFKFVLPNPTEEDQKLRARDVEALHPQYVIFRNGRKISRPDFQLCETEQLPADERTARLLSVQTQPAAEYSPKKTPKNPKGAGRNAIDEKRGDTLLKHWDSERIIDGKLPRKKFWEENYFKKMTLDEMNKAIEAAQKRRNRKLK